MKKKHANVKGLRSWEAPQKRHTHSTAAALEDLIAIQIDVINVLNDSLEYVRQRAARAMDVARTARGGPHAYNPDRPSGRRIIVRRG